MKRGKRFLIYGAYRLKRTAEKVAQQRGAYVVTRTIRSDKRYVVLKKRGD